jgi:hypothetical protein
MEVKKKENPCYSTLSILYLVILESLKNDLQNKNQKLNRVIPLLYIVSHTKRKNIRKRNSRQTFKVLFQNVLQLENRELILVMLTTK